jgi:hypothetical protein
MENSQVQMLAESLRKHGIADHAISVAIADAQREDRIGTIQVDLLWA